MFDRRAGEVAVGSLIGAWNRAAGVRRAFASTASKRAARSEIAGDRGAGGVGGEHRECVLEKTDGTEVARGDVGS